MGDAEESGVVEQESPSSAEETTQELEVTGESELSSPEGGEQELSKSPEEYEREVEGLRAAVKAERDRRQYAESIARQQVPQQQKAPLIDPEQYVQGADVERYVQSVVAQKDREAEAARIRTSVDIARAKYKDEFDKAVELANELSVQKPWLTEIAMRSDNTGEAIMDIAQMHPSWSKLKQAKEAQKVAKKIARNTQQPKTLSDAGGAASPAMSADKIKNMSDEEFDAYSRKVMGY